MTNPFRRLLPRAVFVLLIAAIPLKVAWEVLSYSWLNPRRMQQTHYADRAARKIISLCRSEKALWWNVPAEYDDAGWAILIPELASTPPLGGSYIRPHEARLAMARGHDHYGYYVSLDPATSRSGFLEWDCWYWGEGVQKKLFRISVPASDGLSDAEFLRRAEAYRNSGGGGSWGRRSADDEIAELFLNRGRP